MSQLEDDGEIIWCKDLVSEKRWMDPSLHNGQIISVMSIHAAAILFYYLRDALINSLLIISSTCIRSVAKIGDERIYDRGELGTQLEL